MLTRSLARSDLGGHAAPTAEALPTSLADTGPVSGEPPQLVVGFELDMTVIAIKRGVRSPLKAMFNTPIVSSACGSRDRIPRMERRFTPPSRARRPRHTGGDQGPVDIPLDEAVSHPAILPEEVDPSTSRAQ